MALMPFFVYILRNVEGRFYIGQTSDPQLRLRRHNQGRVFSTKGRGPWNVIHTEAFETRSQAMAEESRLKSLKSRRAGTIGSLVPLGIGMASAAGGCRQLCGFSSLGPWPGWRALLGTRLATVNVQSQNVDGAFC